MNLHSIFSTGYCFFFKMFTGNVHWKLSIRKQSFLLAEVYIKWALGGAVSVSRV